MKDLKTVEEIREVQNDAKYALSERGTEYAGKICDELMEMMLREAGKESGNSYVDVSVDINSQLISIVEIRKNGDGRYLKSIIEEVTNRFVKVGYGVNTFGPRSGSHHNMKISW